ncbi:NAD-dependent epimerase/dehydratase family protein [Metabacillus malikii]|uniref:Nucleoside-diphosphate-sugar epimerase n=1 Tax=Metabacillus malikii TaxID=1504265 RepID=A0ABT9ZJV2_9BACI|nr:NAD-dependent epimerase/dehydratase family protein [Metabacillus malikii]MDQ0232573.1 nucleoside-diphosphate-sugar epimerase [Metabacillus malikii]
MNVLVTGATGFLGKHLAERLVRDGHTVTGIGRNHVVGNQLINNGIIFKQADLENRQEMIRLCEKQDIVFHCGALSSPWGKYIDFYNANVLGTMNVIEGCKTNNVKRLIHVSTPSIYFAFDERRDVKESDSIPAQAVNAYAKTKYLAEQEIDKAFMEGLPTITIRPRAIFGPGDNAILPRLIKVCEKGIFPKIGDATVEIDLTYIDNVVDALILCINSNEITLGQKYNITNGETADLYELIDNVTSLLRLKVNYIKISAKSAFLIAGILEKCSIHFLNGKEPLLTRYTVSLLSQSQTLSIEKAKLELGYQPKVSIEQGINTFIEWWEEHDS